MFRDDGFRAAYLTALGAVPSDLDYGASVEAALEALADHLETHLDVAGLLELAR